MSSYTLYLILNKCGTYSIIFQGDDLKKELEICINSSIGRLTIREGELTLDGEINNMFFIGNVTSESFHTTLERCLKFEEYTEDGSKLYTFVCECISHLIDILIDERLITSGKRQHKTCLLFRLTIRKLITKIM